MAEKKQLTHQRFSTQGVYSVEDIAEISHLSSLPGEAPYLRGPHADMYRSKRWTIRQYTGFASAEETNKAFHKTLQEGGQGLSVAFDLPTHLGYDSTHPDAASDVGMSGVAIDSVEDMKRLFAGIDLSKVSVSMTMNGAVLPVMAAFIVAAEESGVSKEALRGTIQNDILKEFMVRNTYIYGPEPSIHAAMDVVEYLTVHLPDFNSMSISGYHFQEAGADPCLELALTLANARVYLDALSLRGIELARFCRRLSFFFGVGMAFYPEIAKLRAARVLWHEEMVSRGVTDPKAQKLRMHCQTSGWSLSAQEPMNNIIRTTIEAMGAVFGGTQSLHTNAYDEALSIPTDDSARLARNTQLILQHESGIGDVVDPWAGSYMMESMTQEMIDKVKSYLDEMDEMGGVIKAIEEGWVANTIHSLATQKQARIDCGNDLIVGVNHLQQSHQKADINSYRHIDGQRVRDEQTNIINELKRHRNEQEVSACLARLTDAAKTKSGNLLAVTIEAIRARATIGECTEALSKVWKRNKMPASFSTDLYAANRRDELDWQRVKRCLNLYTLKYQQPKILIAKLGLDGHDRGAKVVAAGLADLGFDVSLTPLFQKPEDIIGYLNKDCYDILGMSILSGSHLSLIQSVCDISQAADMIKIVGGVIPADQQPKLQDMGIDAIFTPGTPLDEIAIKLIELLTLKSSKTEKHLAL